MPGGLIPKAVTDLCQSQSAGRGCPECPVRDTQGPATPCLGVAGKAAGWRFSATGKKSMSVLWKFCIAIAGGWYFSESASHLHN